jgi:hypothetical protein
LLLTRNHFGLCLSQQHAKVLFIALGLILGFLSRGGRGMHHNLITQNDNVLLVVFSQRASTATSVEGSEVWNILIGVRIFFWMPCPTKLTILPMVGERACFIRTKPFL